MELTQELSFTAPPEQVAAMLVDPGFARHVAVEVKATRFQAKEIPSGLEATFVIPAPQKARGFVGPELTIVDTVSWDSPLTGRMALAVTGLPAKIDGPISLRATPEGCLASYQADLRVRVPLLGAKIEKYAAQYMATIIKACERVGNAWLEKKQ